MSLKDSSLNQVRLNVKNDQTYTMTAALPFVTLGNAVIQGYTTNVGDLGKAAFTSNVTTGANFTFTGTIPAAFLDLNFASTAASSTQDAFQNSSTGVVTFLRCVFHGARGAGLNNTGATPVAYVLECEAYACNGNNSASIAGFLVGGSGAGCVLFYNCYSHDHAGSNGNGYSSFSGTAGIATILVNCIADTCAGIGLLENNTAASRGIVSINCNYYNNTGDAIKRTASASLPWSIFINNNFVKNTGLAINNTVASSGGILYNNGRGSGTQANGGADTLQCILDTGTDITYASNVTPWNAPTTGDFSTILAAAKGVGRGVFTETDGTNTGTVSYPDIGAAQAIVPAPSGGLRLAGSGGLAA